MAAAVDSEVVVKEGGENEVPAEEGAEEVNAEDQVGRALDYEL